MSRSTRILVVAAVALPALLQAQADTARSACPSAGPGAEVPPGADSVRRRPATPDSATAQRALGTGPDIILRASVSARELRFAAQPHVTVRLCGGTLDSVRVVERRNLPTPVVAGTTYRNVYVAVEILGHLTGTCIANTLTGGRAAPPSSDPCASLGVRDSAGARRVPPTRRPE